MKFKNITSQKAETVEVVQSTLPPSSKVQVFQRKDTIAIYSVSGKKNTQVYPIPSEILQKQRFV